MEIYESYFGEYDMEINIIDTLRTLLVKSAKELVKDYIKTLHKVVPKNKGLSFLNAGIINSKVTRILMKLPVSGENNLDIVTYSKSSNMFITENFFDIFETYVRMNVYELTGVDYTTFKQMYPIEKTIFLKYLNFKLDTINISVEDLVQTNENDNLYK